MTMFRFIGGGTERLAARYRGKAQFLKEGARPIMKAMGDKAVEEIKANIESFTPGEVQDLAESTKKSKKAKYGTEYPILRATGEMMNSMYSYVEWAKGWLISIRFRGARNREIALRHIHGDGVPPRDFMKLSRAFRARVFAALRAGLWR